MKTINIITVILALIITMLIVGCATANPNDSAPSTTRGGY
jgi:PBP1b-binding outer membrane lipoprotein LpoB